MLERRSTSEILIVNGPPGIGKTTVVAALRALLAGTVAISGDALRAFAPADVRAHLGGGATYRAAGALAGAYLEMGAPRVLVDYVFLRAAHIRYFREALPSDTAVKVFTLWAPLEVAIERDQGRAARQRIGPDVRDAYREMQQNLALLGEIVDCAASEPALTAARVHELARALP